MNKESRRWAIFFGVSAVIVLGLAVNLIYDRNKIEKKEHQEWKQKFLFRKIHPLDREVKEPHQLSQYEQLQPKTLSEDDDGAHSENLEQEIHDYFSRFDRDYDDRVFEEQSIGENTGVM